MRFTAYADGSINLELLIWIKVRQTARCKVRSAPYFEIFAAFKKEGIEIPLLQRDIHVGSRIDPDPPKPERLYCDGALGQAGPPETPICYKVGG